MEMRLGDHLNSDLLLYERSRFRSAVAGVIVTSILTMGLGIFVWPVLKDLLYSQLDTLQMAAMALGCALVIMAVVWLYFIIRLFVRFRTYNTHLRGQHRSRLPGGAALLVALLFVASVPVVMLVFDPIK